MKFSHYLDQRSREAQLVFKFLAQWSPPTFDGLPSHVVKSSTLGGDELFLDTLLSSGALNLQERDLLLSSLDYCQTIVDNSEIIEAGHRVAERVFANVFDLLLASAFIVHNDTSGSRIIYRGHYNSEWQLIPSYLRSHPKRADHLAHTVREGQLAYLRKRYPTVDFQSLTALQQDAVIQHYLSGTRLLDFTKSVFVAAYFATTSGGSGAPASDFGAVYRISPGDIENNLQLAKVEAPELPSEFVRIHRQQGVFVETEFLKVINEPALFDRWLFYHTEAGLNFECDSLGVTSGNLLPDEILAVPHSANAQELNERSDGPVFSLGGTATIVSNGSSVVLGEEGNREAMVTSSPTRRANEKPIYADDVVARIHTTLEPRFLAWDSAGDSLAYITMEGVEIWHPKDSSVGVLLPKVWYSCFDWGQTGGQYVGAWGTGSGEIRSMSGPEVISFKFDDGSGCNCCRLDSSGRVWIATFNYLHVFDPSGRSIMKLHTGFGNRFPHGVNDIGFGRDSHGETVALGTNRSGVVKLCRFRENTLDTLWETSLGSQVSSLAWDHSRMKLAVATCDGHLTILSCTGKELSRFKAGPGQEYLLQGLPRVSWDPSGRYIATTLCSENKLYILDEHGGQSPTQDLRAFVLAWHPSRPLLAIGCVSQPNVPSFIGEKQTMVVVLKVDVAG